MRGSTEGDGEIRSLARRVRQLVDIPTCFASALKNAPYAGPLREDIGAWAIDETLSCLLSDVSQITVDASFN